MVDVFEISVQVVPLLVLLCHFTILPVCPDKVNVPELEPLQTVAVPLIEPPTDTGSTVIVTGVVLTDEQEPD